MDMFTKVEKHEYYCKLLQQTYRQKNEKYGDSFSRSVEKYGPISALTRISDKFNRIENMILQNSTGTSDESLEDSLLDMANYCIMTVIAMHKDPEPTQTPVRVNKVSIR